MIAWLALILSIINLVLTLWYRVPIWSDEKKRIRDQKDEKRLRRLLKKILPSNHLLLLPDDDTTDDE